MGTHGVFLQLEGRRCVVVGSDEHALGKALACARAGAAVTLVAPALASGARDALQAAGGRHVARAYERGDLAGAFLAYAATRDAEVIERLRAEAREEGVLLNVADVPDACDFHAGAAVERGALRVLVGTGGVAPSVAAVVRARIEDAVGAEYGTLVAVVGSLRRLLAGHPDRARLLRRLAQSPLVDHLRDGDVAGAERVIEAITGMRHALAELGDAPALS